MNILYDSLTSNVRRFIKKLPVEARHIKDVVEVTEDYILITYTTGLGKIPDTTKDFLQLHSKHLRGVAASGNKNFGAYFAVSANQISETYGVPIISKFELSGTPTDIDRFMKGMNEIETY